MALIETENLTRESGNPSRPAMGGCQVLEDGKGAIQRSAQRYKDAISGKWQPALKPSK